MSSLTNFNLTNRLFVALIHLWAQDFRLTDIFKSQFVAFEIAWNYITGLSRPWWLRKLLHFWGQLRQHSRTEIGIEQNWSEMFHSRSLNWTLLIQFVNSSLSSFQASNFSSMLTNHYVSLPDHYEIHTFTSFTRFLPKLHFSNLIFQSCQT